MQIELYGGKSYITGDDRTLICVEQGTALVYLFPVQNEKPGRLLLLTEQRSGGVIPSFYYKDDDGIVWQFKILALNEPVILYISDDTNRQVHRDDFAAKAAITNVEKIGYEEAVVEKYRLHQVKDDAFIYQVEKDNRLYYEKSINAIKKHFNDVKEESLMPEGGGHKIYNAVANVCRRMKIPILSFEEVSMAVGAEPGVEEIADLSGFIARKIQKSDPAFLKHRKNIVITDPDDEYGYVIYRALWPGKLCPKDFIAFFIKDCSEEEIRAALFHRTWHMPQSVLRSTDSADIAGRIMELTASSVSLIRKLKALPLLSIAGLFFAVMMFQSSGMIAALSLAVLIVCILMRMFIAQKGAQYESRTSKYEGRLRSELYQDMKGIEKIRQSGSENNVFYRYIRHLLKYKSADHYRRKSRIRMRAVDMAVMIMPVIIPAILIFSIRPDITAYDYIGFFCSFVLLALIMIDLANTYALARTYKAEWDRYAFIMDNVPENTTGLIRLPGLSGAIDMDGVFFSYGKDEPNVLDGISLHIAPGEYVGIVGESGSGKSTLLNILLGFLAPDKGRIYYDNMDLASLDKQTLRRRMGVVLQNDDLISGSIADNLSVMNPTISAAGMMELLDEVGMKEEIQKMPLGLMTVMDSENPAVSGGQKQRIIIARALASDPDIILFDEATGSLDNISQAAVCRMMKEKKCTRIVVAHRVSTIRDCDRILVLSRGRIIEEGSYDDLIKLGKVFARLADRQDANEETESLSEALDRMKRQYEKKIDEVKKASKERDAFLGQMQEIRAEHHMAEEIQKSMLPGDPERYIPSHGVDLFADMDTAWEVGGDYYDHFPIDENRLFFCIGDVSGKGVSAAIFCSVAKTMIATSLQNGEELDKALTSVSLKMYKSQNASSRVFVTLWAGVIDRRDGSISFVNAGHDAPYVIRGGKKTERLDDLSGIPIASYYNEKKPEKSEYVGSTLKLDVGDMLILYTDGLIDSENSDHERYGCRRLEERLNNLIGDCPTARDVVTYLERGIVAFADRGERDDDITLLCLKYLGFPQ